MNRITTWIKQNKLAAVLVAVVVWFVWQSYSPVYELSGITSSNYQYSSALEKSAGIGYADALPSSGSGAISGSTPQIETQDRMVVKDTSLSMVVSDVEDTQTKVVAQAEAVGGYMVSTSLTNPVEAPYATISIRVPVEKLDVALDYYRSLALKVTSEHVTGRDVTDEYVDIQEHLNQLNKTKSAYEGIRARAETVEELVKVQQQLTNIQNQIDNYLGRQRYITQTAALSRITLSISTDEMALPYAPSQTFRPSVIFKYAVRGLYGTLSSLGEKLIWLGVYGVIWVPVGAVVGMWWYKRRKKNREFRSE